jgi:hypothetical protein
MRLSPFLILLPLAVHGAGTDGDAFFREKVRPILSEQCFKCHSHEANKMKGGLVLDSREAVLTGGDTGPAVVPGDPEKSLLIKAIRYTDEDLKMPPEKGDGKKLPDADIAALTEWVKLGAPWPAEAGGQKMTARPRDAITAEDRKWWAIQPMAKPAVPKLADHPIDTFVVEKLNAAGLKPTPAAAPAQLARRLYFDLIGLPPSPEQTIAFTVDADRSGLAKAVEKLADELLASPRYGERWARHWLDVARYAESDGYKLDEYRPTAWLYRDYVVRAFNSDKPYDRFVQEQLAGDELFPGDPEALTGTGFLRAGIYEYNNRDVVGQWTTIMNEITDVTGDVFLGLGVQCARCHDHKFDPILQKDYFRLQAFFAPLRWVDDRDVATEAQRKAYKEKLAAWEAKTADLRAQIAAIEDTARERSRKSAIEKFPDDVQAAMLKADGTRTPYEQQIHELAFRQVYFEWERLLTHVKGDDKDKLIKLQKELSAFDAEKPAPLPVTLTASDIGPTAPPVRIPKRDKLGEIAPGFPTILEEGPAKITPFGSTTGRRAALAKWLTNPENPLTARVIVNRVWQYHFGRGLATNASDFGKLGDVPSHPELLDWLARRFVADGWSPKKLHKLIVTSAAYQRAAAGPALLDAAKLAATKDPENRLLWRYPTRRLDAEQVRDAILSVTGELDPGDPGASVAWDKPRRTIYTKVLRNTHDSLLEVFDPAGGFQSTAQRDSTTTSTQALTLFNGPWILARAKALAERAGRESSSDEIERAATAMRIAWGREPSTADRSAARKFLDQQTRIVEAQEPEMKPVALTTGKMPFREGRGVVLASGGTERLVMKNSPSFPDGDFTIEAFIVLDSLYPSGSVRTIASHWDGSKNSPGWTFGVTGKQSRYKPQTLVLLLNGEGTIGGKEPEPIFSALHLEIGKPYYVAVSVRLADREDGITFYAKDLSNDDLPLQQATVPHKTVAGIRSEADFTLGARNDAATMHVWDGIIDDVRLSRAALPPEALLLNSGQQLRESTVGYWKFEENTGVYADSSTRGNDIQARIAQAKPADPRAAAFVDFCHVLLNSNEFLYLD